MLKLALIAAVADLFFGTGAGDVAVGFLPVIIGIGAGLSAAGFGAAAGTIALAGAAGALGGSYLQGQQRDAEKAAQRERDRLSRLATGRSARAAARGAWGANGGANGLVVGRGGGGGASGPMNSNAYGKAMLG